MARRRPEHSTTLRLSVPESLIPSVSPEPVLDMNEVGSKAGDAFPDIREDRCFSRRPGAE